MNKFLKKMVTLGIATIMTTSAFGFVGCGNEKEPKPTMTFTEAMANIDSLISNAKTGKNFTADFSDDIYDAYEFEGNALKVGSEYYFVSDNKDVRVRKNTDNKWQKDLSSKNVDTERDSIISEIDGITWSSMTDGKLNGKQADGDSVVATVGKGTATFVIGGETELSLSKVGKTDFTLPTIEVDNTVASEAETAEVIARVENFIASLSNDANFTYQDIKNSTMITVKFDYDLMMVEEDGVVSYYSKENGQNYVYTLESDNKWHKNFTETDAETTLADMQSKFDSVVWGEYIEARNTLNGSVGTTQLSFILDGNRLTITQATGSTQIVKDFPAVILPQENVVDDTVEKEYICQKVNGELVFDVVAIKDVLEPWLKNESGSENQFGKDFFAYRKLNDNYKTNQILYVNATPEKISFGVLYDYGTEGEQRFGEVYISDKSNLYTSLADGSISTKEDFRNFLLQMEAKRTGQGVPDITLDYSTSDMTSEEKAQYEAMTTNIFDRIVEVGYQGYSINNEGTKIPEYANAKVLFGMKTPDTTPAAGFDMGYVQTWDMHYIIEINGQIKRVIFGIIADANGSYLAVDQVVNNNSNKWIIPEVGEYELDIGNLKLFQVSKIAENDKEL